MKHSFLHSKILIVFLAVIFASFSAVSQTAGNRTRPLIHHTAVSLTQFNQDGSNEVFRNKFVRVYSGADTVWYFVDVSGRTALLSGQGGGGGSVVTEGAVQGDGTFGDPVTLTDGEFDGDIYVWDSGAWVLTTLPVDTKNGYYGGNGGNGGDNTVPSATTATLTNQLTHSIATSPVGGTVPLRVVVGDGDDFCDFMSFVSGPDSLYFYNSDDNMTIRSNADETLFADGVLRIQADSVQVSTTGANAGNDFVKRSPSGYLTKQTGIAWDNLTQAVKDSINAGGGSVLANEGVTMSGDTVQLGSAYPDHNDGIENNILQDRNLVIKGTDDSYSAFAFNNSIHGPGSVLWASSLDSANMQTALATGDGTYTAIQQYQGDWVDLYIKEAGSTVTDLFMDHTAITISRGDNYIEVFNDSTVFHRKPVSAFAQTGADAPTPLAYITKKWAQDSLSVDVSGFVPFSDYQIPAIKNISDQKTTTIHDTINGNGYSGLLYNSPAWAPFGIVTALDSVNYELGLAADPGNYSVISPFGDEVGLYVLANDGLSVNSYRVLSSSAVQRIYNGIISNQTTTNIDSTKFERKIVGGFDQTSANEREYIQRQFADANYGGGGGAPANAGLTLSGDTVQYGQPATFPATGFNIMRNSRQMIGGNGGGVGWFAQQFLDPFDYAAYRFTVAADSAKIWNSLNNASAATSAMTYEQWYPNSFFLTSQTQGLLAYSTILIGSGDNNSSYIKHFDDLDNRTTSVTLDKNTATLSCVQDGSDSVSTFQANPGYLLMAVQAGGGGGTLNQIIATPDSTLMSKKLAITGNLNLKTTGNKIFIATGSNASVGSATLTGGTVTVSTTAVTSSSLIFLTYGAFGGVPGVIHYTNVVNGTSFDIVSASGADTSTVNWWIIN